MPLSHYRLRSGLLASFLWIFAAALPGPEQAKDPEGDALVKAEALIAHGRSDEALGLLRSIAATNPNAEGLQAKLGKAYYEKRSWARQSLIWKRQ